MDRRKASVIIGAVLSAAVAGSTPARAQTFQSYRCVDGTQFIVAFYQYDKRAYLQIDGRSLTLARRFGLSGARYSGSGVTLKITRDGATVKHARRPATACGLT
ncbi:MAG TPA: MliC family protein [Bradyrhizobium sp.]|jgi:membrane-bound inhibitor of C-type lysozyme|nr:MliC family protein [Bradyrhizobium sp.]